MADATGEVKESPLRVAFDRLEPGRTRRNQLPGRVEASPVAPDGQDRSLRHPAC